MKSRRTCPIKRINGVESWKAVWIPIDAWAAPGPRETRAMPGRPVSFP